MSRRGSVLRRVFASFGITSLALAAAVSAAPAASANQEEVGTGHYLNIDQVLPGIPLWIGAIPGPNGANNLAWCIQGGLAVPLGASIKSSTPINDPQLAYILGKYQGSDNANTRSALGYLVHQRQDEGTPWLSAADSRAVYSSAINQLPAVRDLAHAYLAEADAYAGPYSASAGGVNFTNGHREGALSGIGLKSKAGNWMAGQKLTVTLSGAAKFTETGSNTWTGTSKDSGVNLNWVATGNEKVTYKVTATTPYRSSVTRLESSIPDTQNSITIGNVPESEVGQVEAPGEFDAQVNFQPTATSKVQDKVVDKDADLVDTLEVSIGSGQYWLKANNANVPVTFEGTAYAMDNAQVGKATATVPAGAKVVGTANITATGPGNYTSPAVKSTGSGFVTWVWQVKKAGQPTEFRDYIRGDWSDQYGMADETTSVRHEPAKVATSLSASVTSRGDYLVDDLWVEGLPADYPTFTGGGGFSADTKEFEHTLYFFPGDDTPTDEKLSDAIKIGVVTTPAKNGFYPSLGSTEWKIQQDEAGFNIPGAYAVVTTLADSDRVPGLTTSATDVNEQHVVYSPVPIYITTQAHAVDFVMENNKATVWDTAVVEGTIPDGATTTFELFEWPSDGAPVCTEPVWTSEPVKTVEGEFNSPEYTVDKVTGTLGFVETTRDRTGETLSKGRCGESSETLVPMDVTTVAKSNVTVELDGTATVWDTAQAEGFIPEGSTTTFELYQWPTGGAPVCTEPIWTSEPVTTVVGSFESPKFVVDKVTGTLGFVEVTRDASGNVIDRGGCGEASETFVPKAAPAAKALPITGATVTYVAIGALVLIGAGVVLVVVRRRKATA